AFATSHASGEENSMKNGKASLFIVYLRFGTQKDRTTEFMAEHVEWIRSGMDDGVFLCAGTLPHGEGGVLLAYGLAQETLEQRLTKDPFVEHDVVTVEVVPISVGLMQEKAAFLTGSLTTP